MLAVACNENVNVKVFFLQGGHSFQHEITFRAGYLCYPDE
jgi:hypothetical protein